MPQDVLVTQGGATLMEFPEYETHDALALAGLVARGEVSAAELVEAAIARIDARNPALNAVVARCDERARQAAREVVPGQGPLAGVPYLLKDLGVMLAGMPTSNGMAALKDLPASRNSTVVDRLLAAGLVILGKTNTPEFGLSYTTEPRAFGPTRNPWNPKVTAGGSSGGAAAAVAAGMVPAAHASDGGGSIRVPAACCGLFGLKPTRARVPMGPLYGEAWSGLATTHALTRSVRDSAALLDAVAGPECGDPYWAPPRARPYLDEVGRPPGRLRIALQTSAPGVVTDPACRAAVEDAARLCEALGHVVEPAAPAIDRASFQQAFMTIVTAHTADDLAFVEEILGRHLLDGELAALTAELRIRGRGARAPDYARARNVLHGLGRQVGAFLETYDLLLTPTTARPPVPLGHLNMDAPDVEAELARQVAFSPFTQLANATGCPAMSVPLGWSEDGLPLGSMFMAAMGREDLLFRLAAQLEAARPWTHRRPPVCPAPDA